ncbi:hypothetical protein [Pleomorphomonas koreensis]|uniref:hypothetical protein n=1 Tax=Pleomorphomonas koreensis TaxID=257440 RepID=UPI00047EA9A0|nr:hypothetical protein [Pleomorphomonas koreensis]
MELGDEIEDAGLDMVHLPGVGELDAVVAGVHLLELVEDAENFLGEVGLVVERADMDVAADQVDEIGNGGELPLEGGGAGRPREPVRLGVGGEIVAEGDKTG